MCLSLDHDFQTLHRPVLASIILVRLNTFSSHELCAAARAYLTSNPARNVSVAATAPRSCDASSVAVACNADPVWHVVVQLWRSLRTVDVNRLRARRVIPFRIGASATSSGSARCIGSSPGAAGPGAGFFFATAPVFPRAVHSDMTFTPTGEERGQVTVELERSA